MSTVLEDLQWRYATKKFDPSKKITEEQLAALLEAARLSPTSYGLQPFHVFVVNDAEIREKLKPVSWNQSQVVDASHLLVFANHHQFDASLVDNYLKNVSETRGMDLEQLKGYGDFMKSKLLDLPEALKNSWTARQAYIALSNVMTVAASLKIDTCPMEGFERKAYDEILGFTNKSLTTTVVLPVGYRSEEDETQHYPKVRRATDDFVTFI